MKPKQSGLFKAFQNMKAQHRPNPETMIYFLDCSQWEIWNFPQHSWNFFAIFSESTICESTAHFHFASIYSKTLCDLSLERRRKYIIYNFKLLSKGVLSEMESASSDSVAVDEIKDLLTCSLCSKTLNEPRILPCFHGFCEVCLGEFLCLTQLLGLCLNTFAWNF